jgi:hypothetical protein
MRHPYSTRRMAALLMAVAAVLALSLRQADAAPKCKADGASCMRNANCCSGQCLKTATGRKHVPGVCVSGHPNGEACSSDSECISAHCADGVCCNTACAGSCFACDGGTCAPKAAGEQCDDGLFCTATDTCNGSGSCQGSGTTCPLAEQSEYCTNCNEATDSCSQFEGLTCGLGVGQACQASFQCGSNFCVDGVCCDTDCSGTCEACSAAKTGGSDGTCASITADTDPDSECAEGACVTGLCNGAGGCGVLDPYTPCDDGLFCTPTDTCDGAGLCVGTGVPCNGCDCIEESDQCTTESCP